MKSTGRPKTEFQQPYQTFVLSYFPNERGVYNFELPEGTRYSAGMDNQGNLRNPETRFAGITKQLVNNDFEATNVEFIEFWMLSPFLIQILPVIFPVLAPDQQGTPLY
ncbi:MAG: hypothetical protein R2784_11900 [Saprospiraceae bacterium]